MGLARVGDKTGDDSVRLWGADRDQTPGNCAAEVDRLWRVSPVEG